MDVLLKSASLCQTLPLLPSPLPSGFCFLLGFFCPFTLPLLSLFPPLELEGVFLICVMCVCVFNVRVDTLCKPTHLESNTVPVEGSLMVHD